MPNSLKNLTTKTFIVLGLGIIVIGITVFALNYFALNYYGTTDYSERCELNIGGGIEKAKCYVDLCENLTGIEKAVCYVKKNNLNKSLDVCNNDSNKYICYRRIAIEALKFNEDMAVEICGKIENYDHALYCFSVTAGYIAKKNISKAIDICREKHPMCVVAILRVLVAINDTESALNICKEDLIDSMHCYTPIAFMLMEKDEHKALHVCDMIKYESYKERCHHIVIRNIAGKDIDKAIAICENISSPSDSCYRAITRSIAKKDPKKALEVCEYIQQQYIKDFCYEDVERLKNA